MNVNEKTLQMSAYNNDSKNYFLAKSLISLFRVRML